MKLPVERIIPEFQYHEATSDNPKALSSYIVEDMIFIYDWSSHELVYNGFRDTDRLVLKEEHMAIFGRKMMRGFNYLRFGINKETHQLTLCLV